MPSADRAFRALAREPPDVILALLERVALTLRDRTSSIEPAAVDDPHLDPPPNLIASTLFDGLFQAPALLFVIVGLVRLAPWLRPLGLFYAGAAVTNMFFYFTQTFLGPHPPPNTAYYLAFNLPWLIAPAVLGLRVLLGRDLRAPA